MAGIYQESCPEGKTDNKIIFTINNDRVPATTKGCICQTNVAQPAIVYAGLAATAKIFRASEMAESFINLARSAPLLPIHDSTIAKID